MKNQKDFFAGLLLSIVGGSFAWGAYANYDIGRASSMGPGYFPLMLGVILTLMGMGVLAQGLVSPAPGGGRVGAIAWRQLACILGANVVFGALLAGVPALGIPAFGLVVAIFALVPIASLAGGKLVWKEVLILATVLATGSYLTFIKLLSLQFPAWPSFITG